MLEKTKQVETIIELDDISVQKRSIWLWKFGLFVIWIQDLDQTQQKQLIELCKSEKCLFVQIETLNYDSDTYTFWEQFQAWYFKKFITPYTALIDLSQTEEDILKHMKPKGRYNIKLASKKWVEVYIAQKTDANIELYHQLSLETTQRDKFSWHSFSYYQDFLHSIENAELILAKKDKTVIAGGIFVFDTEVSYYYYGASSSAKEFRNLMAPYLLQWHAIQHAQSLGSKLYDFLGVSWEWADHDPSLSWVTDFKRKLTPNLRKVSESYIYVNQKISYQLLILLKKLKKKLKA